MPGTNLPQEKIVGESISKHVWISLTGPAVGSLKDAFFGPSVKVLQKSTKEKGVTTQAEEEECITNEAGRGEMTPRTTDNIKPETESPTMIVMAGTTAGAQKFIKVQQMYRVVLLGDTRAGKSSVVNAMFGEDMFRVDNTECQAESKSVHGRRITLINTPDLFSPGRSEEELKPEILRCVTEFPPGPHAFLIVLKVDKSTKQQQQAVIEKICQYFSEEAFKYAAVVFTQDGSEGMNIQDFIDKYKRLSDLVKKCKSRFHTINNYKQQGDNISNQSQMAELLNTIKEIVEENKGRCYTSKMLPQGDTCSNTNKLIKLTGPAAQSVAKAFSGPAFVVLTQRATNEAEEITANKEHTQKNTKEDGETIKENDGNKGEDVAEETEAQEGRTDGKINEAEQDQRSKDTEEEKEEEATLEAGGELGKESQEKTEGNEDDKDGIICEEEQDQRPKETEEVRPEAVGELGKESQKTPEGNKEDKDGIIHEMGQDQRPKETEENAEDRSQEEKILGHRQAAGSVAPAVGAGAAGVIAAAGSAATAGVIAAAGSAATAGVKAAAGSAATAGVIAAAGSAATAGVIAAAGSAATARVIAAAGSAATAGVIAAAGSAATAVVTAAEVSAAIAGVIAAAGSAATAGVKTGAEVITAAQSVAEATGAQEGRTDGKINEAEQDQRSKDTEEEKEEEATLEAVGELGKESQEKTEGNEDDKDGIIREEEQDQRPKETEEEREEATPEAVGELGKESQKTPEGNEDDKDGIIHETGQDQCPKETEEKAEDRSQEEKVLGHRQAAGGVAPAVGAGAAGVIAASGSAATAGVIAAAGIAATPGVKAVAEVITAAQSVAEATGATAAGATGAGGAAGSVAKVAIATGGAIGVGWTIKKAINWVTNWVKQHLGVVLLVLVFYSLLLSWFFLEVPFVGTLFLLFLLLLLVIILVVI